MRGGRDVKRVGVSAKRRFWLPVFFVLFCLFFLISSYQMIHGRLRKALSYDMTDGVFSLQSIELLSTPEPTVHSFPECNVTKTE